MHLFRASQLEKAEGYTVKPEKKTRIGKYINGAETWTVFDTRINLRRSMKLIFPNIICITSTGNPSMKQGDASSVIVIEAGSSLLLECSIGGIVNIGILKDLKYLKISLPLFLPAHRARA
jgi:hypothetical protein